MSPIRFQQLMKGIDKVLVESRKKIDITEAINQGYGEDSSVFAEGQIEAVIEAMFDSVYFSVTNAMTQFLVAEHVEQSLKNIEEIIRSYDLLESSMIELNRRDRESARLMLNHAQLPTGINPMDVVKYRAHEIMKIEKGSLLELIEKYDDQTNSLDRAIVNVQGLINMEFEHIDNLTEEFIKAADNCSSLL
jgi:hypothetical protein